MTALLEYVDVTYKEHCQDPSFTMPNSMVSQSNVDKKY